MARGLATREGRQDVHSGPGRSAEVPGEFARATIAGFEQKGRHRQDPLHAGAVTIDEHGTQRAEIGTLRQVDRVLLASGASAAAAKYRTSIPVVTSATDSSHAPLRRREVRRVHAVSGPLVPHRPAHSAASSSSVAPPRRAARRSVSRSLNRQDRTVPSAVNRVRSQSLQNDRVTDAMMPTVAGPPSTSQRSAGADGSSRSVSVSVNRCPSTSSNCWAGTICERAQF